MPDEPTRRGQPTRWPTVEEQLRESKVKPGSALEKLILENQDFEMLGLTNFTTSFVCLRG